MRSQVAIKWLLGASLLATSAGLSGLSACSSGQKSDGYLWNSESFVAFQHDNPDAGERFSEGAMPAQATFTGVYRSQQIGDVQLVQNGESVVGRYAYNQAACRVKGKMEGQLRGNLLRFTWTETKKECGVLRDVSGHGYFLFTQKQDDTITRVALYGEWGLNEAERGGGPWVLSRLRNQQPYELMQELGMEVHPPSPDGTESGDAGAF